MPVKGSKRAILASYRAEIVAYPWASDTAKLERFMSAASATLGLEGEGQIDRTGHSWKRALELNGYFDAKRQTLKFLRALPES